MTFAPLRNDAFLRACWRLATPHTPVWLMRQAGRYLPEYRATRAKAGSFMGLATQVDYATEVTLQPLERYPLDAAILFSDILTVPDAMGLGLYFVDGEGPKFERPIRSAADVERLAVPDMDRELRYVMDAVRLIRRELAGRVPLIGFSGSPWTLACYMVEGQSSRDFARIKALLREAPGAAHRLLDKLARAATAYLRAQIEAGVDAVMLFDTWGGALDTAQYLEFSLAYMRAILAGLPAGVPTILFTKGGGAWLEAIAGSGCTAIGLDWLIGLDEARRRVGENVTLQGNLDPATLLTDPETIRSRARQVIDAYGHGHRHIFNLGHGITPEVPPEHVQVLVETVHEYSPKFHGAA